MCWGCFLIGGLLTRGSRGQQHDFNAGADFGARENIKSVRKYGAEHVCCALLQRWPGEYAAGRRASVFRAVPIFNGPRVIASSVE